MYLPNYWFQRMLKCEKWIEKPFNIYLNYYIKLTTHNQRTLLFSPLKIILALRTITNTSIFFLLRLLSVFLLWDNDVLVLSVLSFLSLTPKMENAIVWKIVQFQWLTHHAGTKTCFSTSCCSVKSMCYTIKILFDAWIECCADE